jgi:hypothetical protein
VFSRRRRSAIRCVVSLLVVVAAAPAVADGAPKTDVIVLNNGDRLTAEIKSLERGRMTLKTDALSTVSVHWGDVISVKSARTFEVEVASGLRYYGSLATAAPQYVLVQGQSGTNQTLALLDIVRLSPLEGSFWARLDGSIDLGFNYTEASRQTQWTLNASVQQRRRAFVNKGTVSSQLTHLQDSQQTRNSLAAQSQRFLRDRWFTAGVGQVQQDGSLGLDYRTVIGGVAGRYVLQNSHTTFAVFSGLGYTHERFSGDQADNSAEALAGIDWQWFSPGDTDTDLSTSVLTYYNITGRARARLELNSSFKREVVKNLYWSLNGFDSFDSSPPGDQKKNDFGVTLSLGWSF